MTTADPRAEIRRRIAARLSNDEWMTRHFALERAHANVVADAALELFDEITVEHTTRANGVTFPGVFDGMPVSTQIVLKTAPEEQA